MRRPEWSLILALLLPHCAWCGPEPWIAELVAAEGTVERQPASAPEPRQGAPEARQGAPEAWQVAHVGDRFSIGSGLRTSSTSRARLRFQTGGRELLVEPLTIVRFLATETSTGEEILLELGSAELVGGGSFRTRVGTARLLPGSRARLEAEGSGRQRFEVLIGAARLHQRDGSELLLEPGEIFSVEIGGAELTRVGRSRTGTATMDRDRSPPARGPVIVHAGKGVSVRGAGQLAWRALPTGTSTLTDGDRLRVSARGEVDVERQGGHVRASGPAELEIAESGGSILAAELGQLALEVKDGTLRIELPGGALLLRPSRGGTAKAQVRVDRHRQAQLQLDRGEATVLTKAGEERLRFGEKGLLAPSGELRVIDRAPSRALLSLPAGDSAVIHDAAGQTPIAIVVGSLCREDAIVEVRRRSTLQSRALGSESVIVLARAGARYRVSCLDAAGLETEVAKGSVEVVRDTGTGRLLAAPPENTVDSDGRRYRVLYQDRLPRITMRWRRAPPKVRRFTLHLSGPAGDVTRVLDAPVALFEAGTLSEGRYQWWLDASGVERSPTSTLEIDFDNAAPAAHFELESIPARTSTALAASTVLAARGVALLGSEVWINDAPVVLDRHARFQAEVPLSTDAEVVVVRIRHPRRGNHYYVRRLRPAR
ncbi:MAG: hypothetical protein IT384_10170 [Deltaproteobacteria bacterium]|nr:hypothetical protein [Deltaproteobacteria bacterium]